MRIQVSGKQIDVGEALQGYVADGLTEATGKYAGRPTEATVVFSRDGHAFNCEVTVHLSTGLTAQARGAANDCRAAFDAAREKMAKQLRRHKRRLKDHHKARPTPIDQSSAGAYVLAPLADQADAAESDEESAAADEASGLNGAEAGPAIIAETRALLPSLTVGEAVLQMELAHAPVLVFRNEKRGGINVVYRREDGNIGWIDPGEAPATASGAPGGSAGSGPTAGPAVGG